MKEEDNAAPTEVSAAAVGGDAGEGGEEGDCKGKQLVGGRHDVTDSASDVVDGPNAHRNRGRMPHFRGQEPNARASFMSRTFVSRLHASDAFVAA